MTVRGTIRNGVVVLDAEATLAEGTIVRVESIEASENTPTLYEQLQPIVGTAKGLPPDLATQHDHYIHGQPKK